MRVVVLASAGVVAVGKSWYRRLLLLLLSVRSSKPCGAASCSSRSTFSLKSADYVVKLRERGFRKQPHRDRAAPATGSGASPPRHRLLLIERSRGEQQPHGDVRQVQRVEYRVDGPAHD